MDEAFVEPGKVSMALRDYLRVLFRHKLIILTSIVTIMLALFAVLELKTPQYESSVKILISAEKAINSPYYRELGVAIKDEVTPTQSEIVTSGPVLERAVKALKLYKRPPDSEKYYASVLKQPLIRLRARLLDKQLAAMNNETRADFLFRMAVEDLKHRIKVKPIVNTNIFILSVKDYNPGFATTLANVVSRSYVIFDLEQQLAEMQLKYGEKHLAVLQLVDNINKMIQGLSGERLSDVDAIGPASVKVIEQARVPLKSVGPSPLPVLFIGFFISLFVGGVMAFAFEYLDETFRNPQDIERFLGVPYLGCIPRKRQPKFYNAIADHIYATMKDRDLKTLLIGSRAERDESATVVINIGTYMAQTRQQKTLIVDANFRKPVMHRYLRIDEGPGLAEVLEQDLALEEAVKKQGDNLDIMVAGKSTLDPAGLLSSEKMREFIALAKHTYRIVLINAPVLGESRDGMIIVPYLDAVSLVVSEGKTRRQAVKASLESLLSRHANVIGVILNNRSFVIPKFIYDLT